MDNSRYSLILNFILHHDYIDFLQRSVNYVFSRGLLRGETGTPFIQNIFIRLLWRNAFFIPIKYIEEVYAWMLSLPSIRTLDKLNYNYV